jgi:hypothetical protein
MEVVAPASAAEQAFLEPALARRREPTADDFASRFPDAVQLFNLLTDIEGPHARWQSPAELASLCP